MTYRVIISDEALAGVESWLDYLADTCEAPFNAERWWRRALSEIMSLDRMPNRHSIAPEDEYRDYTIRALVVDRCVFLYYVDDDASVVRIIGFRHGSQMPMHEDLPTFMPE